MLERNHKDSSLVAAHIRNWLVSPLRPVACVLFLFLCAGQVSASDVAGIVTDPQGLAVAGAKVTITRAGETRGTLETTTDQEGKFVFHGVPSGEYVLTAEARAFKAVPPSKRLK